MVVALGDCCNGPSNYRNYRTTANTPHPKLHWTALKLDTPDLTSQNNTKLYYNALHYTSLHYTPLHYTKLPHTTRNYTKLHYTIFNYTKLHNTTLHCTTLHYTTSQCTALHFRVGTSEVLIVLSIKAICKTGLKRRGCVTERLQEET